jgi:hypothetical protein
MERIMFPQSPPPAVASPYKTKPEAAEYIRCSVRTLDRLDLPRIKRGGRVLFHIKSLDAAMLALESK